MSKVIFAEDCVAGRFYTAHWSSQHALETGDVLMFLGELRCRDWRRSFVNVTVYSFLSRHGVIHLRRYQYVTDEELEHVPLAQ